MRLNSPPLPTDTQALSPAGDPSGHTALLLLSRPSEVGRALLIVSPKEALVYSTASGPKRIWRLRFRAGVLPFINQSFDSVIVDVEKWRPRRSKRLLILQEADRILRPCGRCVLVTSHRRIPRSRRSLGEYRLVRSDAAWKRSVAAGNRFEILKSVYVRLDDRRLVEVLDAGDAQPDAPPAADRHVMVLCHPNRAAGGSVLDMLVAELQMAIASSDGGIELERFLVRRIGKTTLSAVCEDGRRYVIRVARSPIAAGRALRNFAALQAFHTASFIPNAMKALVPQPRLKGAVCGYDYYVEDARPGTARDDYPGWSPGKDWEPQALRFIYDLHHTTRRVIQIDRNEFDRDIATPLRRVRRRCGIVGIGSDRVFDTLGAVLERSLIGEFLPFVWSHGDYAGGNCLYDTSRVLSGVVDWELFSECQLPLLDLLHCMDIPAERNSRPTWQRFDAIFTMLQCDCGRQMPAVASYVERMEISQRVLPALLIMYWIDHVANRIDGRADDAAWMKKRVSQPLAALASLDLS
jgi:aminoglycoside phosphotransferase (APT) family kinase protein/SAM-dependent methyltransferase